MKILGTPLHRLRDGAETAATVASAHRAGLLRALAEGPVSTGEAARRAGLDPRAARIVLAALEEFGLVERRNDAWEATETCRRTLCDPSSPEYAGGGLDHWLETLRAFTHLHESLETGEPVERGGVEDERERLRSFMAAMAAAPRERVERIVRLCLDRNPGARRVLDLGGGPGHMSRAFVEAGLEATLADTPETVAFVGEEYGLEPLQGLELVGLDFHEDPLPEGPFDVVLLSNVAHIYGPEANRRLLEQVGAVVAPGGVAAVMDFVRGRSPRAARFALVMLLRTEGGDTYTVDEITGWLKAGGFGEVRVDEVDQERQLVTGVRPA